MHSAAYLMLIILAAISFWPGLHGSFYYDDFPHLVNNHAVLILDIDPHSIYRATFSGHAGPTGRPLSMASFAIEHALAGLSPFHFKLVNLMLHLANALLAAWLVSLLLRATTRETQPVATFSRWLPLWVAAFWVLHPLTASAVLYVIQRMTLLATFFSLFGMITYCSGRLAIISGSGGWLRAFMVAPLLILAGIYSKETAIVAAPILLLIEALIFRFRVTDQASSNRFGLAFLAMTALCATFACWELYKAMPGFLAGYQIREFTPTERLLTEARVLWKYIAMCLVPDYRGMALFHDDFPVSTGLLIPITTLASIAGLIALAIAAVVSRKRLPLVTLGIGWFLIGHLPESTVIPLELMHEHRNYFPLLGLILAIVAAADALITKLPGLRPRVTLALTVTLLAMLWIATFTRASELGDANGYFIYEALRHPDSARSNTEAAIRLIDLTAANPRKAAQLTTQAQIFLDRAIASNKNEIHAPFVGVMAQPFLGENALSGYYRELKKRLQINIPHRSTPSLFATLNKFLLDGKVTLSESQVNELYQAAISNPRLSGKTEIDVLVTYASYKAWQEGDMEKALQLIDEAAAKPSADPGVNLVRASIYFSAGKFEEAKTLIGTVEKSDTTGYYAEGLTKLKRKLETTQP